MPRLAAQAASRPALSRPVCSIMAATKPAAKRSPAPVTSTTSAGSGGTYRSTRRPTSLAPRPPILTITRSTPALSRKSSDSGSERPQSISSSVSVENR